MFFSSQVKIVLLDEDCPEMLRDFENYLASDWSDWARTERPIRKSISLYQSLFKIHATIHTSDATPPELVWGIGIGRWKHQFDMVDMPLIEQLVDIEIEEGGAISIRPRNLAPIFSLKPYLELGIDGSARLARGDAFYQAYYAHKTAILALATVDEVLAYEVEAKWPEQDA